MENENNDLQNVKKPLIPTIKELLYKILNIRAKAELEAGPEIEPVKKDVPKR